MSDKQFNTWISLLAERDELRAEVERLLRRLEWHEAMTGEVGRLNAENERLREAFVYLAPLCRRCDRSLTAEDVITAEQPGEGGVWTHPACWEAEIAEMREAL